MLPSLLSRYMSGVGVRVTCSSVRQLASGVSVVSPKADPGEHGLEDVGQLYMIPLDEVERLSQPFRCLSNSHMRLQRTLGEGFVMIRQPALQAIGLMRSTDPGRPLLRVVLHGRLGYGKSTTLFHCLHYAARQPHCVTCYMPWAPIWTRYYTGVAQNPLQPQFVDLPSEGVNWLRLFRTQNGAKIERLRCGEEHVWTKRESVARGASLAELVEFGISRALFSNSVVRALLRELRSAANAAQCSLFIGVDGANAFWQSTTIRAPNHSFVPASSLTLVAAFTDLLDSAQPLFNATAVLTADAIASPPPLMHSKDHLPRALLTEAGFQFCDPFVPVRVPLLSRQESRNYLNYLIERDWLRHEACRSDSGKDELLFLAGGSARELVRVCAPL